MSSIFVETVTGPLGEGAFRRALAHEHLFVDFLGPADPGYRRVDWEAVRGACLDGVAEVRRIGVDLLVDCTCIGVGRSVRLIREVSVASGIRMVAATGIYKAMRPPSLREASVDDLAGLFVRELDVGIGESRVRAGFIKLATTENGPTEAETIIHRAGAMAAVETGTAIVLHSPQSDALEVVLRTFESEGFEPTRLVWAHAQDSPLEANLEMASRGVTVSLDAIGSSDDDDMLGRIERLAAVGGRFVLSSDSCFFLNPADPSYQRDIGYLDRVFATKLEARFGGELLTMVRRDNVFRVFGRERIVTDAGPGATEFPIVED